MQDEMHDLSLERKLNYMIYSFDREWTTEDIRNLVRKNCYLDIGKHEDLKALVCMPYAEDENERNYNELIFVVPSNWLQKKAFELFKVEDLNQWLCNEYTSDESEVIFSYAIAERKVVMVDFTFN